MDQELIAYLDARFRETAQQIAASREETAQQIAASRDETAQQIARLREETSGRFEQVDSRFEKLEETTRHTIVLMEGMRHELHLVAESVVGTNERLERYHREATLTFHQVKEWIEPYFRNLDSRVNVLDGYAHGLDLRVRALEGQADHRHEDVMNAIRKMLGKPPLPPPVTSD